MDKVLDTDFDGVFRFSNNSDQDFTFLWNNREYTFPAKTRSPMLIQNETPENVQEIRKKAAYKWAEKEWFKTPEYKKMASQSDFRGGRDDKVLEPLIQMCLEPLPTAKAIVKEGKKEIIKTKASKAVGGNENLNRAFADDEIPTLGVQSNNEIN